ncbi:hypothetical protein AM500_06075 [Bacillus sp. FJAT-18017]|uniref:FHA domain-containing protein n=1 Tax=Bacillus sp. FJAT-18017 TaxID=1705566 RepID=UPI0006AFA3C0|nr:FHA domain-containing protein [Bacillus sp. FJAT-18017]ALC89398.1 hypothetical protein AM500_06075 [Bacillus sp. FJAT-18017]
MGRKTIDQNQNTIKVEKTLNSVEAINEREMQAIARGLMDTLIPVSTKTGKKGAIIITTAVTDMITLKTYFTRIVSKKMFLDTVTQIVSIVKECETRSMNAANLMLNGDQIFIDPRTKKVKCIYLPIVNNHAPASATKFFKELPFGIVFTKHEDHSYIKEYLNYFKNVPPFSINSFEKVILGVLGKKQESKSFLPTGGTGETGGLSDKAKNLSSSAIAYNPLGNQGKTCPGCGGPTPETANFCPACGTALTSKQPAYNHVNGLFGKKDTRFISEPTILGAGEASGTTVLGAELPSEPVYPYLVREKTQEKIVLNKPSYRIGKEKSFCDYFVSDNNAISRSHADIITRENRYYIVDHNSTNKTYVDGRAIPVKEEIEIFSGTRLRLANEEFVFYL